MFLFRVNEKNKKYFRKKRISLNVLDFYLWWSAFQNKTKICTRYTNARTSPQYCCRHLCLLITQNLFHVNNLPIPKNFHKIPKKILNIPKIQFYCPEIPILFTSCRSTISMQLLIFVGCFLMFKLRSYCFLINFYLRNLFYNIGSFKNFKQKLFLFKEIKLRNFLYFTCTYVLLSFLLLFVILLYFISPLLFVYSYIIIYGMHIKKY